MSLYKVQNLDYVNALDFGVNSDNTDNYTQFTKAIEHAKNTGKKLYIPEGTFKCSAPLVIPSNFELYGSGMNNTILVFGVTNGLNISKDNSDTNSACYVKVHDLQISHKGSTTYGLRAITTENDVTICHSIFENIRIDRFSIGVTFKLVWMCTFNSVKVYSADSCGFYFYEGTSCVLNSCYVVKSKNSFYLRSMCYTTLNSCASDQVGSITTESQDKGFSNYLGNVSGCAYRFLNGTVTLNSCGTEGSTTVYDIFVSYHARIVCNACYFISKIVSSQGRKISVNDGNIIFNACKLEGSTAYESDGAFMELNTINSLVVIDLPFHNTTYNFNYKQSNINATGKNSDYRYIYTYEA